MIVGILTNRDEEKDFEKMCATNKFGALQATCYEVYKIIKDNNLSSWNVTIIYPGVWQKHENKNVEKVKREMEEHGFYTSTRHRKIDLIFTDEEEAMLFKLIYEGNEDGAL